MTITFLLDTFPSLSETFLYTLIDNLQKSGFKTILLARKRGKAIHTIRFHADVRYLPAETLPFIIKIGLVFFFGFWLQLSSPSTFRKAISHFQKKQGSVRQKV